MFSWPTKVTRPKYKLALKQLDHYTTAFNQKSFPIVLILDSISSPANIGSLFRLAEAFGVQRIISCGTQINLDSPRLKKTARSTIQRVPFEQTENCLEVCTAYLEKQYSLIALEITATSRDLSSEDFSKYDKIALIIGHESVGVSHDILKICHNHLHVPMFGANSSMNVAQVTGISLYEITKTLPPIK